MPEPDWAEEAARCAAEIVRMKETPPEGAMILKGHQGVFVTFGPNAYLERTKTRLADRGAQVLGTGRALNGCGVYTFAILYRQKAALPTSGE